MIVTYNLHSIFVSTNKVTTSHNKLKTTKMELREILNTEINSYDAIEPNVKMFVDDSSIFWVTKDNEFVWMIDHSGIYDYIEDNHIEVEEKTPNGVGNTGVYWMNKEFESPFHISDFTAIIDQIN